MSAPVGSLKNLRDLLEGRISPTSPYNELRDSYAFYSVLMYTPNNGLNEALHKYMVGGEGGTGTFNAHAEYFNALTGQNWLVAVVEDISHGKRIEEFKPEEVYNIARFLGARVDSIPGIVFFTEPKEHKETLVLGLREILPDAKNLTEDNLTEFFQKITGMVDDCSQLGELRLHALSKAINKEWPKTRTFGEWVSGAATWSVANGKDILESISLAIKLVHPYASG